MTRFGRPESFELVGVVTDVLERKKSHQGQRYEITLYDENGMKLTTLVAKSGTYTYAPPPGTRFGVAIVPERTE